jgi:hypothetical protein
MICCSRAARAAHAGDLGCVAPCGQCERDQIGQRPANMRGQVGIDFDLVRRGQSFDICSQVPLRSIAASQRRCDEVLGVGDELA